MRFGRQRWRSSPWPSRPLAGEGIDFALGGDQQCLCRPTPAGPARCGPEHDAPRQQDVLVTCRGPARRLSPQVELAADAGVEGVARAGARLHSTPASSSTRLGVCTCCRWPWPVEPLSPQPRCKRARSWRGRGSEATCADLRHGPCATSSSMLGAARAYQVAGHGPDVRGRQRRTRRLRPPRSAAACARSQQRPRRSAPLLGSRPSLSEWERSAGLPVNAQVRQPARQCPMQKRQVVVVVVRPILMAARSPTRLCQHRLCGTYPDMVAGVSLARTSIKWSAASSVSPSRCCHDTPAVLHAVG